MKQMVAYIFYDSHTPLYFTVLRILARADFALATANKVIKNVTIHIGSEALPLRHAQKRCYNSLAIFPPDRSRNYTPASDHRRIPALYWALARDWIPSRRAPYGAGNRSP